MSSVAVLFDHFTSTWSLVAISAALGIILVWLYKFISFQKTIYRIKRKISAELLEPLIFRDSPLSSIGSFGKLSISAFKYLSLTLPPFLILGLPVVWIFGYMNQSYGYESPKRPFTVNAELKNPRVKVSLSDPSDKNIISLPVRSFSDSTISWRVTPNNGELKLNDLVIYPALKNGFVPVFTNDFTLRFLYPGNGLPIPDGVSKITLDLPARKIASLHWIFVFLIVSIVSGLIFARLKQIEI